MLSTDQLRFGIVPRSLEWLLVGTNNVRVPKVPQNFQNVSTNYGAFRIHHKKPSPYRRKILERKISVYLCAYAASKIPYGTLGTFTLFYPLSAEITSTWRRRSPSKKTRRKERPVGVGRCRFHCFLAAHQFPGQIRFLGRETQRFDRNYAFHKTRFVLRLILVGKKNPLSGWFTNSSKTFGGGLFTFPALDLDDRALSIWTSLCVRMHFWRYAFPHESSAD